MKILSRENEKQNSKSLLIPCYLYEIIVCKTCEGNNILEEAVAKIISIDSYYKNHIEELAKLLGLKDSSDEIDYRALLTLVISKLSNSQTQEMRKDIKQYQIYQERISGEVLGIITQDVNSFIEASAVSENKINFEKDGKTFKALKIAPNKNIAKPTKEQIFAAIAKYNKNADFKISENLDLEVPQNKEELYLHCHVFLQENRKFSISNGFNSALSPQLERVLEKHCDDVLRNLREGQYTDEKIKNNYKQIYKDLRDVVAHNLSKINLDFEKESNNARDIYNAYEKYFEYLVDKNNYASKLIEPQFTKEMAHHIGFKVDKDEIPLSFFTSDNKNNLKSHLATLLYNKDETLTQFADKNPYFLMLLSQLHKDRNVSSHGGDKEKNYKAMDKKELGILKELLEVISEINTQKSEITHSNNGIVLLEENLDKNTINALSEDDINDLASVYGALELCENNSALDLASFSKITLGLSKACESVLLKYIQIHQTNIKKKNIQKARKIEWLSKVREFYINSAKKGRNATLGAYTIIYLSMNENEKLDCIRRLLELRKHSNPSIEDLNKTNVEELRSLHKDIINLIIKLIHHI